MTYSRPLDGLRGIAILLVLLFHYNFLVGFGWMGVQLFFVLSGFLITSILLKDKEAPLDFYLKRFYWRRTLRIFPLYYLYLILVGIVFIIASMPADYPALVPFLATYTFNFYPLVHLYSFQDYFFMHFWSLSVEEQFYLFWPLLIYFFKPPHLKWVLIAIIASSPLIRYGLGEILLAKGYDARYTGETVYRFSLSQWDGFAFGALIPVFGLTTRWKLSSGKLLRGIVCIVLLLGFWNYNTITSAGNAVDRSTLGYEIGNLTNYQHVWSYTLLNLLFCLLIVFTLSAQGIVHFYFNKLLSTKVLVYFGKISYGLYVYHFVIWMAFNKFIKPKIPYELPGFILYVSICLAVSTASYYLFERHLLLLKDKFLVPAKLAVEK